MMRILQADTPSKLDTVRALFLEYADSLGFSLCFQNFQKELDELPGQYARPSGLLMLAECDDEPAGCVALRKIGDAICEMKRLYVRPAFRGKGIGRLLVELLISEAIALGYSKMRLDTVAPRMRTAVALYRELGFYEIEPYTSNPVAGATFMELNLDLLHFDHLYSEERKQDLA